uniref:Neurotransmitter-gated ion-channel ligand-binding domain-containing protein n=1 Tax=Plectus sambesii TaxID=2011161 RepID=A0A914VVZ6_9BILA
MSAQLFAILLISLCACAAWASEDEKKLLTKLFENYDTRVRPVLENSDKLTVEVGVTLRKLIKVNPVANTFEAIAWIVQKWQDYQLRWDPTHYGGINRVYVPQTDVFKTDLVLYNSAKAMYKEHRQQPNKVMIMSDGAVLLVDSVKLTADCLINDTATEIACPIILGSWVYDMSQIDLKPGTFSTDPDVIASPMWTVTGMKGKRVERFFPKWELSYVSVNIDVNLSKNKNDMDVDKSHEKANVNANDL